MRSFLTKLKTIFKVFLILALAMPTSMTRWGALALTEDKIINPAPTILVLEDGQKAELSKTAEAVEGWINRFKVTLKITAPKVKKTSDTVLIIDTSGSMKDNNRLTKAKAAANDLAEMLLKDNTSANRIAVVPFSGDAEGSLNFSNEYNTVVNKINSLTAAGGTFTQSGVRKAIELINGSTAAIKNVVLLSDGEPTYSYKMINPVPYLEMVSGNQKETNAKSPRDNYTNERVGDGSNLTARLYAEGCANNFLSSNPKCFYNHGNSAIAEAGFLKASLSSVSGNFYAIALDTNESGTKILEKMASAGKFKPASPENLAGIFREIGGVILSSIYAASVHDEMGLGVKVVSGGGESTDYIDWVPEFKLVGDEFVAEKSYEVIMDESVLGQNSSDGFYELNESAVLKYNNGKEEYFPIPKVKPFVINVEKELVENGQEISGKEFRFKISGNNKIYSVKSGESNTVDVVTPIQIGTEYVVIEEAWVPEGNTVDFENYKIEYTNNKFIIGQNHGDKIGVKIKNTYDTTSVTTSKKWNDENDRDGLRKNYNLFVAVKDDNKYIAYQPIESTDKNYTFFNLPKYRNNSEIEYTVVEAKDCTISDGVATCVEFTGDDYYGVEVRNNIIMNFHEPATTSVLIKKTWAADKTNLPKLIRVNLSGGEIDQTFDITADDKVDGECTKWCKRVDGLYKYDQGKEIKYTVKETDIFGVSPDGFIEYGTDETNDGQVSVNGKWDANTTQDDNTWTITNTWTQAQSLFNGSTDFSIKKIDMDGNPLSGVKFTVNGEEKITDSEGKILIEIPANPLVREEIKNYEIIETETQNGYELDGDAASLEVVIVSGLASVVSSGSLFTNNYTKTFTFIASGNQNYTWNKAERMFILKNNRSVAKALTIEKTFSGVTADVLKNSDLTFVVSGPEDFETKTIPFSDFAINGNKATFILQNVPTGDYTVKEIGGNFDELFTLTTTGNNQTKTLSKNACVKFVVDNTYNIISDVVYEVEKIWDDDNDRDGVRPEKLSIDLMANGSKIETVELGSNDWSYKWENLPRANVNGEAMVYSVVEKLTGDYEQTEKKVEDGKTVFINKHTPALVNDDGNLTVVKIWEDGDDLLQFRPKMIMVNLLANGRVLETVPVVENADGLWTYTFTGLYKFSDGEEIEYSVEEDGVNGYSTKINGGIMTGRFEIINTSTNPCSFGGCGYHNEDDRPKTPNTGKTTISGDVNGAADSSIAVTALGGVILTFLIVISKRNKKEA